MRGRRKGKFTKISPAFWTQVLLSRMMEVEEIFSIFSATPKAQAGIYRLVAGLMSPTALLMKGRFFNLPVPAEQDFFKFCSA